MKHICMSEYIHSLLGADKEHRCPSGLVFPLKVAVVPTCTVAGGFGTNELVSQSLIVVTIK